MVQVTAERRLDEDAQQCIRSFKAMVLNGLVAGENCAKIKCISIVQTKKENTLLLKWKKIEEAS